MKAVTKPPFYFSAYRLKTLEQAVAASAETNPSPYLHSLLSGKTKTTSRIRVSPLANPYKQENSTVAKHITSLQEDTMAKDINWFHHYE